MIRLGSLRQPVVWLFILVFSFSTLMSGIGYAMDKDQKRLIDNQILDYNIIDSSCTTASSPTSDGGTVDRFMQVLAHQESGGNPTARNPASSAAGKYQYLTSTWQSRYDDYPPARQYPTADKAPEAVQDAVVKIEYTKKMKSFSNDPFKLAVSHFYPIANTRPELLDVIPPRNVITPRQYADSVVNKIKSGIGLKIGLFYAQAPDFAVHYGQASGGLPSTPPEAVPVSTDANSCTNIGNGKVGQGCGENGLRVPQGGTGTNICYFNQASLTGGNYNWPGCGCLPTSSYMIQATFEKKPELSNVEVLNGIRAKGGVWSNGCDGVVGGALRYYRETLKYEVQVISQHRAAATDAHLSKVVELLGQGYLILTHTSNAVDSAGKRASAGHFLVIHAVDAEGNFYVANPGAQADNNKAVTPERMKAWLDGFYAVRKPGIAT